ncbi:unnamed protein product [Enterobius vermicularis]|uniref:Peptidase_M28 domain-containing protein n=1 Tax=Enterobius vermicularis TaxID=51028 RepID=A0A0N4VPV1_ENTVE|nr:unnamed protein product [Enterobius vermicularis]
MEVCAVQCFQSEFWPIVIDIPHKLYGDNYDDCSYINDEGHLIDLYRTAAAVIVADAMAADAVAPGEQHIDTHTQT